MINNFICDNCNFQNKCVAKTKLKPFLAEARTDLGVDLTLNKCNNYVSVDEGSDINSESN